MVNRFAEDSRVNEVNKRFGGKAPIDEVLIEYDQPNMSERKTLQYRFKRFTAEIIKLSP